jgi:hypothetical protein
MKKGMNILCLGALLTLLSACSFAPKSVADAPRMDRSKFLIGGYCFRKPLHSESYVKDLKECGIDFVVTGVTPDDVQILDILEKYSIGAVVSGALPSWWGGDGSKAGQLRKTHPVAKYEERIAKFTKTTANHPAVWMVDICDEPSALDLPYLGEMSSLVMKKSPKTIPYLNLYPNYASVSQNTASQTVNQLGTPTYKEHIDVYCRTSPLDYISYDYYVYSRGKNSSWLMTKMYDNYNTVADACRRTGRSMWYIPQVNSRPGNAYLPTTTNMLRFQAYTSMAFGAEAISWACLMKGWWTNNVYTVKGEKTEQFEKLKEVNAELHRLGPMYMRYRNTATHYIDFDSVVKAEALNVPFLEELDAGWIFNFGTEENTPLLVGEMAPRQAHDSSRALFVVPTGDAYDKKSAVRKVSFSLPVGSSVKVFGGKREISVERSQEGKYSFNLPESAGALLIVTKR